MGEGGKVAVRNVTAAPLWTKPDHKKAGELTETEDHQRTSRNDR